MKKQKKAHLKGSPARSACTANTEYETKAETLLSGNNDQELSSSSSDDDDDEEEEDDNVLRSRDYDDDDINSNSLVEEEEVEGSCNDVTMESNSLVGTEDMTRNETKIGDTKKAHNNETGTLLSLPLSSTVWGGHH